MKPATAANPTKPFQAGETLPKPTVVPGKMDADTTEQAEVIDALIDALNRAHALFGDGMDFKEIHIRFDDNLMRRRIAQKFAGNPIVDWLVRGWDYSKGQGPAMIIGDWWDKDEEPTEVDDIAF